MQLRGRKLAQHAQVPGFQPQYSKKKKKFKQMTKKHIKGSSTQLSESCNHLSAKMEEGNKQVIPSVGKA